MVSRQFSTIDDVTFAHRGFQRIPIFDKAVRPPHLFTTSIVFERLEDREQS